MSDERGAVAVASAVLRERDRRRRFRRPVVVQGAGGSHGRCPLLALRGVEPGQSRAADDLRRPARRRLRGGRPRRVRGSPGLVAAVEPVASVGQLVPDPGGIRAGRGPEHARGLRRRRLRRLLRAALRLDRCRLSAGDGTAGSDPVRGRVRAAPGLPGTALGDSRGLGAVRGRGLPPRRRDPGLAVDDAAPQPGRPLESPRCGERHRRRTRLHGRPGDALVVDRAALERSCGPARLGRLPPDGRRRARLSRERLRREALPRATARVHGARGVGGRPRGAHHERAGLHRLAQPIRASAPPSERTCAAGGSRRCSSCRWSPGTR